jgi:hypothetical protein
MITVNNALMHWNYFLSTESDVLNLSKYVDFSPSNFDCYSIEITRILFASASEADVIAKAICKIAEPESSADNIIKYQDVITRHFRTIESFKVTMPRFGLEFVPWSNWSRPQTTPDWWTAYNKVKHHRDQHFAMGTLKNCLNSVAGLFSLMFLFYKNQAEDGELSPLPQLFDLPETYHSGIAIPEGKIRIFYDLSTI